MRISKKCKVMLACSCLAVASLACGVLTLGDENVTVSANTNPLTMQSGAEIRLSTDGKSNGLRFTANVAADFYAEKVSSNAYNADDETFGMLIVAASYVDDYNAYKSENALTTDCYYEYFKDVKEQMIDLTFKAEYLKYDETAANYYYSGAVTNVYFNNAARKYQSIAYYKNADGTYTYSAPSDAVSHGYVASDALNEADYIASESIVNVLTDYVERAMYVSSGVAYDYDAEEYVYDAKADADYKNLVALNPTIEISGSKMELALGETLTLTATAAPFTDVAIVWSVDGSAVSVNNGVVTANSAGTATVTASYMNGKYSDTYEITVAKPVVALAATKDVETKVDNSIAFTGIDGNVTALSLGNTVLDGWTYDDATDTLALPATSLTNAELGQSKTLTLETATTKYTQKVWVVNKVIKDYATLRTLYSTAYVDIDAETHAISGYYVLGADITCEQRSWASYGTRGQGVALDYYINDDFFKASQETLDQWSAEGKWDGFVGTFDGRGYAIINMPAVQGGMFNKIGEGGVVKNVIFKNVNLRTGNYLADVATIAQENHGTISQVLVSVGAMARQKSSSALVMKNYGTIENVYVRAMKSGDWATHFYAVCDNQDNGAVTNAVVSTTFAILDGTLTGLTPVTGDGWSTANKQWYVRFGTAAEGFCSENGTDGRDGVFVIISDTVVQIDTSNATSVNKY